MNYETMNFKLFKKIIINLLKFVHFSLASVVNLLIRVEDKLITLRIKMEKTRTKIPNSMHHYLDIDQLYTENIGNTYIRKGVEKEDEIDYTMIKG